MGCLRPFLAIVCVTLVLAQLAILFLEDTVDLPWGIPEITQWVGRSDPVPSESQPRETRPNEVEAGPIPMRKVTDALEQKPEPVPVLEPEPVPVPKPKPRPVVAVEPEPPPRPEPAGFSADAAIESLGFNRFIESVSVVIRNETTDREASGVVVGRREDAMLVLTVAHALATGSELSVQRFEPRGPEAGPLTPLDQFLGQLKSVSVVRIDSRVDLALLKVNTPLFAGDEWTEVSRTPLGEPDVRLLEAWSVDCVTGDKPEVRRAEMAGLVKARPAADMATIGFLQVVGESVAGMSGSGLFDSRGRLLGIASGNRGGSAHYISASVLEEFLKDEY